MFLPCLDILRSLPCLKERLAYTKISGLVKPFELAWHTPMSPSKLGNSRLSNFRLSPVRERLSPLLSRLVPCFYWPSRLNMSPSIMYKNLHLIDYAVCPNVVEILASLLSLSPPPIDSSIHNILFCKPLWKCSPSHPSIVPNACPLLSSAWPWARTWMYHFIRFLIVWYPHVWVQPDATFQTQWIVFVNKATFGAFQVMVGKTIWYASKA